MKHYLFSSPQKTLVVGYCIAILFLALVLAPAVNAGDTKLENALYKDATSETKQLLDKFGGAGIIRTPGVIVFNIIQIILGILGIVGVIMMIYAGFLWLTAGGEEEKAKQGRTLLFQVAIGTLIVLAAYTITYFVIEQLAKAVTKG